jgi:hypothetical protein
MFQQIVDVQREIYLAFAGHIKEFAAGGGWASPSCRWASFSAPSMQ